MRNLERFRQSSILSKKPSALFPPKPSIVRSNVIAKCSLVRVFLKAVPGSVQHNTAVDSVTKVPIISGKELKSMKNDLQFRSCTPFRGLAINSDRSRDREPSWITAYIFDIMFTVIGSCQIKRSTDHYHMTKLQAQV